MVPHTVHLTQPRRRRGWRAPRGVTIHTTTYSLTPADLVEREGLRVTAPARSIADPAAWGTAPEQIVAAVVDTLDRGMAGVEDRRAAARGLGRRVADLIELGLAEVGAS